MSVLSLDKVGHAFFGRTILDGIDLQVNACEIVALVGPSGCGKSTLAHIAAGLIEARAGRIHRGYARHAMIFQDPALMPWATAEANIRFALKMAGVPRRLHRDRLRRVAGQVALQPDDMVKYPSELSGGMKQRVSIARALVTAPDFIFFDEPFTALDVALKRRMQDIVIAACASGDLSGLFITHDLMEAARVAHRVAVLDTRGNGILGDRELVLPISDRSDRWLHDWTQDVRRNDPAFLHIHDVDERQIA
ncbi:ABC transporter ATP-binding protein [Pukyongiella litopenaei]|uniref:ATP-binding cassette domain-containing protein n=1 Tax=Pukyongiella litopenaei TaxID=2605946 RepID=A0A2S0MPZ0_9RHOB|nr:ATP-binding cassette domain-containing protein [Pukyongiella litopenaei]AVO37960.1 ATP-binding cassette domain-containing protein [Pukyongiella litopenaei]